MQNARTVTSCAGRSCGEASFSSGAAPMRNVPAGMKIRLFEQRAAAGAAALVVGAAVAETSVVGGIVGALDAGWAEGAGRPGPGSRHAETARRMSGREDRRGARAMDAHTRRQNARGVMGNVTPLGARLQSMASFLSISWESASKSVGFSARSVPMNIDGVPETWASSPSFMSDFTAAS